MEAQFLGMLADIGEQAALLLTAPLMRSRFGQRRIGHQLGIAGVHPAVDRAPHLLDGWNRETQDAGQLQIRPAGTRQRRQQQLLFTMAEAEPGWMIFEQRTDPRAVPRKLEFARDTYYVRARHAGFGWLGWRCLVDLARRVPIKASRI